MSRGPMVPVMGRVVSRRQDLADTVTIGIEPVDDAMAAMRPGQFNMLWAVGVGEVPISVSGGMAGATAGSGPAGLHHTIRAVGAATAALCALEPGASVGVRGPFGTDWRIEDPSLDGQHLVFIAGGLGLAPLRGAVEAAARRRERLAGCSLLVGARSPDTVLYAAELEAWREEATVDVHVTVDRPAGEWAGRVGVVTDLLADLALDVGRTVAFVCGPEIMMVRSADALVTAGLAPARILLSLERNMKCAVAMCGHCQLGAEFVCHDGPVYSYDRIAPLLRVAER